MIENPTGGVPAEAPRDATEIEELAAKIETALDRYPIINLSRGEYEAVARTAALVAAAAVDAASALVRAQTLKEAATGVYGEIRAERERAHAKHGDTSMESYPATSLDRLAILLEEVGEVAKEFNEARHDDRQVDVVKLRKELIQTGAMATAWADRLTEPAASVVRGLTEGGER